MEEDKIKEAFFKVKQDISTLGKELLQIKQDIQKIKEFLEDFSTSTLQQITPTDSINPTDNPTHPQEIGGLKTQKMNSSIGNEGVPTDRQTDQQTGNPTYFLPQKPENKTMEVDIQKAPDILDSLDTLKKQIRHKFKHLTPQELLVFSTIYQLEEQNPDLVSYRDIALKLSLSESSIRDYVQRIINKGIPIKKHKINNKKLILSISPDLRRVATLSTILKLIEL
jgi:hypothetical protein